MAKIINAALATAGKPCDLGDDPSKYLEKFEEWYEHTSLLADSISVKDKAQKLRLTLLREEKTFINLRRMQASQTKTHSMSTCPWLFQTDACPTGYQVDNSICKGNQ